MDFKTSRKTPKGTPPQPTRRSVARKRLGAGQLLLTKAQERRARRAAKKLRQPAEPKAAR